jgi:dephospho-CoA kinase
MTNSAPILVGLTGGIGSGKSTVAKFFEILGSPVYYADDRAKWLMSHDDDLRNKILSAFGKECYREDGSLNRAFLAAHVFGDKENVKTINGLVHPAVKTDFESWVEVQKTSHILKEAALLFETGSYLALDKTINVSSPIKIRINRVLMRDKGRSEAQINDIIDQQLPDNEKNKKADFVIKNNETSLLIPQVLSIHKSLIK